MILVGGGQLRRVELSSAARYSEHLLQHYLSIYLPSLLCSRLTRTQLPLLVLVGCSSWELGWEPSDICNQLLDVDGDTLHTLPP